MFYVCQIRNNLLGSMDECDTLEDAIDLLTRIVEENDVEITDEVKEEIENDHSYLSDDKEWSVCIGTPND